ncbi:Protein of unknown function [Flavobacterium indicum GPTSA100-9 = DSM 17447]|uniref:DUF1508 domain-containing protein n=1 Tax=Flavobacterium indicum (strain DSM 17447 / CIP 109464 / GPTSA100-9) TaxID=1094466 RepID=H8XR81_FLAIG|nr:hypothetical protein [Flavobacterium indicum]CCG54315.1 Protein of unknown function [Flavobacterium indicum GPTSA100-9 = DSM 17447]
MGTFVISQRLSGVYKYEFTSRKGKTIFTSNDFELRFEAEEEIERLKAALDVIVFMRFRSPRGKFYFKMILDKVEVAKSRQYTTQLLMQKGIDEIMRSLASSEILDFSSSDEIFPPAEDVFGV